MLNTEYKKIENEILRAPRFKTIPSVENMAQYLAWFGHPERSFKVIHVAGTNGKGSTCSFLESVLRKYVSLVHGVIHEDSATIDAPIGRDKNNRKKMCVTVDNSKDAVTHIRVLERYKDATLIECKLETGRTHQIRVHMEYINHPVVNDPVYGYNKMDDASFGQMLHAKEIGFVHPVTHEFMDFQADVPEQFNLILNKYKNK